MFKVMFYSASIGYHPTKRIDRKMVRLAGEAPLVTLRSGRGRSAPRGRREHYGDLIPTDVGADPQDGEVEAAG